MRPRLLVSVRNASEAEAALAGGADLIDIKEPANGPLGRADPPVIERIVRQVAGREPVSMAGGELELCSVPPIAGVSFIKYGLAEWRGRDWPSAWEQVRGRLPNGCMPVAVAYADWQSSNAPSPTAIAVVAMGRGFGAFLIDTFEKNGANLLDRMPIATIADLTRQCQAAGVPVALAGSLGVAEIKQLGEVRPDWFAVRGAACRRGRGSVVDVDRVRQLKAALA
jgi:uncharacterized protein (UPF0264 family)